VCTVDDYNLLISDMLVILHAGLTDVNDYTAMLAKKATSGDLEFEDPFKENEDFDKVDSGAIIAIIFFSIILLFVVTGTSFEYTDFVVNFYKKNKINKTDDEGKADSQSNPQLSKKETEPFVLFKDSKIASIFRCFGLVANFNSLVTFAPGKSKPLDVLNGIRVLSAVNIVQRHFHPTLYEKALKNPEIYDEDIRDFETGGLIEGAIAVDVFFWLTGLLGVYTMLSKMQKNNGKMHSWYHTIIFHRWLRVIPMLISAIVFTWKILPLFGGGISNRLYAEIYGGCAEQLWSHFLLIYNFFAMLFGKGCFSVAWYISADFQFFCTIPLFVYLFYHKKKASFILLGVVQTISIIYTIVTHIIFDLKIQSSDAQHRAVYYRNTLARLFPFTIGVLTGWVLLCYHKRDETVPSLLKILDYFKRSLVLQYIFLIVGIVLIYLILFVYLEDREKSVNFGFSVFFVTFHRGVFIIAIMMICLPGLLGCDGVVSSFLSWKIFGVLAKLCYATYLLHSEIIGSYFNRSNREGIYMRKELYYYMLILFVILSFFAAMAFYLCIELPCSNLVQKFLTYKKPVAVKEKHEEKEDAEEVKESKHEEKKIEINDRVILDKESIQPKTAPIEPDSGEALSSHHSLSKDQKIVSRAAEEED